MMQVSRLAKVGFIGTVLTLCAPPSALAQGARPAGDVLRHVFGTLRDQAWDVDKRAMTRFRQASREGPCAQRRDQIMHVVPEALEFSQYARDIYDDAHEGAMLAAKLATLDLGVNRRAHYDTSGRRYAETRIDRERKQVIVVFRGTRLGVASDLAATALNFVGAETGYYQWAVSLVRRVAQENPQMGVVATGQSLGGGLAIYAVLRNPGVRAVAFNPVGISMPTWNALSRADRARANAAIAVVSTRNRFHIEPVTALSLAGRSILPGRLVVLISDALGPSQLHSAANVVRSLENVVATDANGDACEGYLGVLAD